MFFPAGRGCHRAGNLVLAVALPAIWSWRAFGRCRLHGAAGTGFRRNPSRRLLRYGRCACITRLQGAKAGNSQGPAHRRVCSYGLLPVSADSVRTMDAACIFTARHSRALHRIRTVARIKRPFGRNISMCENKRAGRAVCKCGAPGACAHSSHNICRALRGGNGCSAVSPAIWQDGFCSFANWQCLWLPCWFKFCGYENQQKRQRRGGGFL